MKIGELARRTGVSVRSLRYYEEQGLITSERTSGGQRVYSKTTVGYVDLIQLLFRAGVSSRDVLAIMPCAESGTTTPAMLDRLAAERSRLDAKVTELIATRERLDGILVAATARLRMPA
ncbi:MerR family transcriptional regulator [Kribbella sp. CA-293567]|uniref:MerR family transcriptional regulator n=1 Tax=Kribbella sp. CA-293567 TaxID=3002436 RepID=UPI0022DD2084|nr:MerR family transcriptional regulator [Kribbella sp. CA-293567]WBQ05446.1 MerR family transcriptional regulator [Kribbella sp. CA-293567]